MKFLEMEKHAGCIDNVELSIERSCNAAVEKCMNRFDTAFACDCRSRAGGFHPKCGVSQCLEMLQLRSIVGTDIEHRLASTAPHERLVNLAGDTGKMGAERFCDAGKIGVIAEQNFF